jgi:hypothetical protein
VERISPKAHQCHGNSTNSAQARIPKSNPGHRRRPPPTPPPLYQACPFGPNSAFSPRVNKFSCAIFALFASNSSTSQLAVTKRPRRKLARGDAKYRLKAPASSTVSLAAGPNTLPISVATMPGWTEKMRMLGDSEDFLVANFVLQGRKEEGGHTDVHSLRELCNS